MITPAARPAPPLTAALVCAAAGGAQYVSARATRDALYLSHLPAATLPTIVVTSAVTSLLLVTVMARGATRVQAARLVPALFGASAALTLIEWALLPVAPVAAVVLLYLHIAGLGPMLGSGIWLLISERFDPRSAKRRYGHIQGAGTLGGLAGGLIVERIGVGFGMPMVLPALAVLNATSAWAAFGLGRHAVGGAAAASPVGTDSPLRRSGVRVLRETPYLRQLAAVVVLGTVAATIVDVLFKTAVVQAFDGDQLLRFFSSYYAVTAVVALLLQVGTTRLAAEHLGLGWAAATPSLALSLGTSAWLAAPTLPVAVVARGTESVLHASWFRSAYEVFFVPLPEGDRRAAKSLIDVGCDRLGDVVAGGALMLATLLGTSARPVSALLALAASTTTAVLAVRVRRGYIGALERSLVAQAGAIDLPDFADRASRETVARVRQSLQTTAVRQQRDVPAAQSDELRLEAIRSGDPARASLALRQPRPLTRAMIPHAVALLGHEETVVDAARALRAIDERDLELLVSALRDPDERFAVRRRLPDVLAHHRSPTAIEGLIAGLDDPRFEVRFRCGRALVSLRTRAAGLPIDLARVMQVVRREVTVSQAVWGGRQLIDALESDEATEAIDTYLRTRADRALVHVMTLLMLAMPHEPLAMAFGALQVPDAHLRGTALEFLESVLPQDVRDGLWRFIDDPRPAARPTRTRSAIIEDLRRSNQSLALSLEHLRPGAAPAAVPDIRK